MIKYEKPMVLELDDIAEGIYAASGDDNEKQDGTENEGENRSNGGQEEEGNCWEIVNIDYFQRSNGEVRMRLTCKHEAVHISTASIITLMFNQVITSAQYEAFEVSGVGTSTLVLTRPNDADAHNSVDIIAPSLIVTCEDSDTLTVIQSSISCDYRPNVQGGI